MVGVRLLLVRVGGHGLEDHHEHAEQVEEDRVIVGSGPGECQ